MIAQAVAKPDAKPARPWFSAGPTAKRPGWSLAGLPTNLLGRGIRAPEVVERFAHGLRLTREVLSPPEDYVLLYAPGSDTGAVEAALWGMLGERPVQVVAYENFGQVWATDVRDHLKLEPEVLTAPWGELPDMTQVDPRKDVVFPWNGTTSGVRVPNADWIADDREGLAICDATSAAFAMPLPYDKLDVVTFSFQKALGGEAGIGVMVLSPRAVARLDGYRPQRSIPKVLRLTDKKGFDRTLADGVVINTYSILTIEDWIDALEWAKGAGGLPELIRRTDQNYAALAEWAQEVGATRPVVDDTLVFSVEAGRHPVVEAAVKAQGDPYTPNNARLDGSGQDCARLAIVTGPNMAGKSTFLRQNALLVILAQAGAFVPARSMRLGVVDRLFSRVGAGDDLARGRSTFMMEMVETAAILTQATSHSFVVLDEIGRGTATYDGLAIAWATAEALHETNRARTLFATHYHELAQLETRLDHVCNLSMKAREWNGDLVFLHEAAPGAADRSYGVQVARLAGVPTAVVGRARSVLERLEGEKAATARLDDLPLFALAEPEPIRGPSVVETTLAGIDPDSLTPREALEALYRLRGLL